jgi:hypothetical protein
MKELIKRILKEETEEVIKYVKEQGNPLFSMQGNLNLRDVCPKTLGRLYSIEGYLDLLTCKNLTSLGELTHVGGWLDLYECKSLTSLGNLTHVGDYLDLYECENLTSLGSLQHVGGFLDLKNTPIAEKYSKQEIRKMVNVEGDIYLE